MYLCLRISHPDCLRIQLTIAWLNLTMPNQTVKNSLKAKKIKLPQMNFFLKKQLINSSCTYWLLSFCKIFKKIFRLIHKMFLVQTIIFTFIYLLALFTMQNLKKFLQQIQSYEDAPFLGPKWSICPKQFFLENY